MLIKDLFQPQNALSKGFESYIVGSVPFVSNGLRNNGIIGLVNPRKKDRVFNFEGICLSAFCEATVHKPPFLPRGNGGSGLLVLEPKEKLTFETLASIASYINSAHRWKFSYGRMVVKDRINNLEIKILENIKPKKTIKQLLPVKHKFMKIKKGSKFQSFNIQTLFNLERGDFHALDRLKSGNYPTISRITTDNGIEGYYEKPQYAHIYPRGTITISSTTGDAFFQLDDCICTDNVVILIPKQNFSIEELLFITNMINKEKWRISYGRQGYKGLFSKTNILLPITDNGKIDSDYIHEVIDSSYHFSAIRNYIMSL